MDHSAHPLAKSGDADGAPANRPRRVFAKIVPERRVQKRQGGVHNREDQKTARNNIAAVHHGHRAGVAFPAGTSPGRATHRAAASRVDANAEGMAITSAEVTVKCEVSGTAAHVGPYPTQQKSTSPLKQRKLEWCTPAARVSRYPTRQESTSPLKQRKLEWGTRR